jgi:hypothetical protein
MDKSRLLQKVSLGGSVAGAISASLCCIGPLAAVALGAGGFAASAVFEKWRPVFLGATFALLALAWYLAYRKPKGVREDGPACAAKPVSKWGRVILWFATAFVMTLAAFPMLSSAILRGKPGMMCCALGGADGGGTAQATQGVKSAPKDISPDRVSFYEVPLVCPTAPQIGCGSHAKPILLALEKQAVVAEAWLNRSGTRMAVVWKPEAKTADRISALNVVTGGQQLEVRPLDGAEKQKVMEDFLSGQGWYQGSDVDRLSEEEAGIIAARVVRRIQARVQVSGEKADAIRAELTTLLKQRLTGSHTDDEPTAETQVFKVLQAHLDEKDLAVLKETLPRNARPLPGEQ